MCDKLCVCERYCVKKSCAKDGVCVCDNVACDKSCVRVCGKDGG